MEKVSCNISVFICKLDDMKYETLLVLSVNNFIHFNKDTRSSEELPLDKIGKLESKMHDISNK